MTLAVSETAAARKAASLDLLITPRAIALIGASPEAGKLSGRPLAYLQRYGFAGPVYPVNPRYDAIGEVRCYRSVADLPDGVDLALILLPAKGVPEALEACGARGIPFAISIAGGFAEAGDRAAQDRIIEICRRTGIRLIGPNCVGLINPRAGVTATFSTELRKRMPRPGALALVTQSGALGNSLLQSFNDLDIGLGAWVSTGNEADLGVLDLVEHFLGDPEIRVIALFVEGLKDGARLVPLGRRARAAGKAILVLRAGRSQLGRTAAVSHTGKLAGSNKVWRDAALQAGLVEVEALDDLLDLITAFDVLGDPREDAADGLGVLTISGGLGVLISDRAAEHDLPLPRFAAETQATLRTILPPLLPVANPVDTALFTDEQGYAKCADAVLADPSIGTLLLILTSLAHDYGALVPWLETLGRDATAKRKHVALSFLSSSDPLDRAARQRLMAAGILVLPTADRIVSALGRRRRTAAALAPAAAPVAVAAAAGTAERFWARARLPQVPEALCRTPEEAAAFAGREGYPVALKIASPDIAHKTEVGGVKLGIRNAAELAAAWAEMFAEVTAKAPQARIDGIAIQPMIGDGVELIVGCSVDPEMGRTLMVGGGGIWAEAMEDVAFLALPATPEDIESALRRLRLAKLFDGARGRPPLDVPSAVAAIAGLAEAYAAETWVDEVDVNPLILRPRGCVAVDTLLVPLSGKTTP